MAVNNICIFEGHDMRMAKLGDQPDLPEDGFVVSLAEFIGVGDFQGDPNALDGVTGLPDLAIAAFAQPFL